MTLRHMYRSAVIPAHKDWAELVQLCVLSTEDCEAAARFYLLQKGHCRGPEDSTPPKDSFHLHDDPTIRPSVLCLSMLCCFVLPLGLPCDYRNWKGLDSWGRMWVTSQNEPEGWIPYLLEGLTLLYLHTESHWVLCGTLDTRHVALEALGVTAVVNQKKKKMNGWAVVTSHLWHSSEWTAPAIRNAVRMRLWPH